MKRSERYYQESRRQLLLAVACFTIGIAVNVWATISLHGWSFGESVFASACGMPFNMAGIWFAMSSLETRRLAKQSEQAEINRAIRPRL
jgi:hypothetical protein